MNLAGVLNDLVIRIPVERKIRIIVAWLEVFTNDYCIIIITIYFGGDGGTANVLSPSVGYR